MSDIQQQNARRNDEEWCMVERVVSVLREC
jgi:hypothetical protein